MRDLIRLGHADVVHFVCHGERGADGEGGRFKIDDGLIVRSDILLAPPYRLDAGPLVFLNACEMGMDAPDRFDGFAKALLDCGARAVLAPECHVPDDRAAKFECRVYEKVLREQRPLSDAVRKATHELCTEGDPIGLAYNIYGQAEFRFSR